MKYEPQGVSISASSEPIKISESENTVDYYQCYQVSIGLPHQRRVKIIEYMVMWGEIKFENAYSEINRVKNIEITHISTKELILRKSENGKIKDEFEPQIIPLLDTHNNIIHT